MASTRPRSRKQKPSITIGVRISKSEYKRLFDLAKSEDVTLSDLVREALESIIELDR